MNYPIITIAIILLTTGFSLYCMNNPALKFKYIFHPYSIYHYKQHYRFLSHAFIHADYMHLLFNMYALWMFGDILERAALPVLFEGNLVKAKLFYLLLYTGAIYAASITEYFRYRRVESYTSLGASGAVNAVIFSSILMIPLGGIRMFLIPFDMPAWAFGIIFLGISYYLAKRQREGRGLGDNVGHEAHFWGAIFGFVLTGLMKPELFVEFFRSIFHWS
ncbi:MAG: rhomboid family intramembrane serine protease [Bacteroidetes bacterium]|nr:rhomboid family intramembrane serine protease [Bacteroidota bacterium]